MKLILPLLRHQFLTQVIKECIEDNIKKLSFGANSSHVIQKTIKAIKKSNRDYINLFVIANLISLSLDSHGICIVKEFIDNTENICYLKAVVSIFELEIMEFKKLLRYMVSNTVVVSYQKYLST